MQLAPRDIRNGFGRFPTGVTVVTCTKKDGIPHVAAPTASRPSTGSSS
jgi:flavin reductase (DIM6/NTAB) family NADH-FMN oxidoreductase RutF